MNYKIIMTTDEQLAAQRQRKDRLKGLFRARHELLKQLHEIELELTLEQLDAADTSAGVEACGGEGR